jgi:pPIWI_RE three-gene island domain Y/REase associating with pPIWI_RE
VTPRSAENSPSTLDLDIDERLTLLRTVASAVISLAGLRDAATFKLPYPPEAQRALDRTVLTCLRRGARPPQSVPDLLRWCRERAILDWPLELPEGIFTADDRLIDLGAGAPSQLCHELAVRGRDSAVEQYDRAVIRAAVDRCRQAGSSKAYATFRRLLIERPVLSTAEFFNQRVDLALDPVQELIDQIYEPVPVNYLREGVAHPCRRCRTLLLPLTDGQWWCERDVCRQLGRALPAAAIAATDIDDLRHLARPLRQFVTAPGQAEVELERNLMALPTGASRARQAAEVDETSSSLIIEMWPEFDAYDLRVTFPDGHVWALDVKDWASPALLGQKATRFRTSPPYDEAFWVIPQRRLQSRSDYIDIFYRHRPAAAGNLNLVTDKTLLAQARRRLAGIGAEVSGHA